MSSRSLSLAIEAAPETPEPMQSGVDAALQRVLRSLAGTLKADILAVQMGRNATPSVIGWIGSYREPDLTERAWAGWSKPSGHLGLSARSPALPDDFRTLLRNGIPNERSTLLWQVPIDPYGSIILIVSRGYSQPALNAADERAVHRLAWIGDYFQLWWQQRLDRRREERMQAAFDRIGPATFLLDRDARVVGINRAARVLVDAGNGLLVRGDRLSAVELIDSIRLHSAIGHALAAPKPGKTAALLAVQRKQRSPLIIAVLRLAGQSDTGEAAVLLQVVEPDANHDAAISATCTIFGLNGPETRLATHLAGGDSLAEAAATMRIKLPTARTYLKQAFEKTGTNRQAALVHLLISSLVHTGPGVALVALQRP